MMAQVTHSAYVDLRFGNPECENLDVRAGVRPRDFACESLHLFIESLVRLDRHAQPMAERVFC
jgi:hypothetical protein